MNQETYKLIENFVYNDKFPAKKKLDLIQHYCNIHPEDAKNNVEWVERLRKSTDKVVS